MTDAEIDHEVERLLALSDGELRAEVIANGDDPDELVRIAGEVIDQVIAAYLSSLNRLH
jgi:hypothetical protein